MIAKIIGTTSKAVLIALCAWLLLSWIDIAADNTKPKPVHSDYNIFSVVEVIHR